MKGGDRKMRKIEDWVFFENIFHNFSIQRSPNLIRKSHPFFYPKLFNHLANFKTYATYQNRYCQKFQIWEMIEYSFHLEYFISDWFQKQNLLFRQNVNHLKMELPWLKWGFGEFLKHINSQKVETTQMAINRRRDKQNVVYTYNGILFSHKKEWNNAICNNMDGPRDYHTKWSKSDRERQISCDITYMWNLKKKW